MKNSPIIPAAIFGAFLTFLLSSCNSNSDTVSDIVELMPVMLENDDNWSFVDKDGKVFYEDEFENCPSGVIDNIFSVKEGDRYALYKFSDKKLEAIKGCDELVAVGVMNEGVMPVTRPESRIEIINKKGETQFELKPFEHKEIIESDVMFNDGLLRIKTSDNQFGFIDRNGEMIIIPDFDEAGPVVNGLILVKKGEDNYFVIDKLGNTVFNLKKSWIPLTDHFEAGVLVVTDDQRIILVDEKGGSKKLPAKVKNIYDISDDFIVFSNDGKRGIMKRNDEFEILVRPHYKSIQILPDNRFLCQNENDKADILNDEGEKILTIDEFEFGVFYDSFFGLLGCDRNLFTVLDSKGKPENKREYRQIGSAITMTSVHSDFIDYAAIKDILSKLVNNAGVGRFKYNTAPRDMLLGEPNDYRYSTEVDVDWLSGTGYQYSYKTVAHFTERLTKFINDDDDYLNMFVWNKNSRLNGFELTVDFDKSVDVDLFRSYVNTVESAGFKLGAMSENKGAGEFIAILRNVSGHTVVLQLENRYKACIKAAVITDLTAEDYEMSVRQLRSLSTDNSEAFAAGENDIIAVEEADVWDVDSMAVEMAYD